MGFNIFMNVFRVTICCIVFAYCLFVPFKSRLRYGYPKTALLAFFQIALTVSVVILFLTHGMFLSEYSTLGICLWLICSMLIFRAAVKGSFFELLFIVLVILNLYVNIVALARVVISVVELPFPTEIARALVTLLILVLCFPLLWFLMVKLYKRVIDFSVDFQFWRFIWTIPALSYMMFFVKIVNDYWKHPVQAGAEDVIFIVLWSFTSYALFCVTLLMLVQTYEGMNAKAEASLLASQVKVQGYQYEHMLDNIEKTARLRHDWRHHLLSINSYAENRDLEGLHEYIRELLPVYSTEGGAPVCANHIANAILMHHAAIAKTRGVDMKISANIKKVLTLPDTDLCIVLGNLVENAVEACVGDACIGNGCGQGCAGDSRGENTCGQGFRGRVEIKADMQGKQLILFIKNTYSGRIILKDGIYYSTKHEGAGIGLSSVKKVVEKNDGIMKIEHDEKFFSVYILLRAG